MSWLQSPASGRSRIGTGYGGMFGLLRARVPDRADADRDPDVFSNSQYLEFPLRQWSLRWYENYFGSIAWMQATAICSGGL
jgi:putative spermidine/putrescine transport system permease protein